MTAGVAALYQLRKTALFCLITSMGMPTAMDALGQSAHQHQGSPYIASEPSVTRSFGPTSHGHSTNASSRRSLLQDSTHQSSRRPWVLVPQVAPTAVQTSPSVTQDEQTDGVDDPHELGTDDILDLDLEQLSKVDVVVPAFRVPVSSVVRSDSTVGKSPAAVFVITNEMIRRSGATSIPEALRMAPGLFVAKVDSNKWAITSRGFNGEYANKLLVLMDGRSVYSPTFSGVHWDRQDTVLEDIDRIEVIRGPGASAWGANAVNGVINIITKEASETHGLLISAGVGSEDKAINTFRYGNQLPNGWDYRIYGKHLERDAGFLDSTTPASDDWRQLRIGTRGDWRNPENDNQSFSFVGEFYSGTSGANSSILPSLTAPFFYIHQQDDEFQGGFVLLRWQETLSKNQDYRIQAYYDRRHGSPIFSNYELEIFDIDFQHRWLWRDRHQVTWGAEFQHIGDRFESGRPFNSVFLPAQDSRSRISGFLQDELSLIEDELSLLLGVKLEHNDVSGFEYQPTVRLWRSLSQRQVAWAAVSRAVRTPSRVDHTLNVRSFSTQNSIDFAHVFANPNLRSEDLLAFEVGYRAHPSESFSWDAAIYYHDYSDLVFMVPTHVIPGTPSVTEMTSTNLGNASLAGIELSANWKVSDRWSVSGWYAFSDFQEADAPLGSLNSTAGFFRNQWHLISSWNWRQSQFDAVFRAVDTDNNILINDYHSLDLRWNTQVSPSCELSFVAQNVLDSSHSEAIGIPTPGTEVQRGIFGQLTIRR